MSDTSTCHRTHDPGGRGEEQPDEGSVGSGPGREGPRTEVAGSVPPERTEAGRPGNGQLLARGESAVGGIFSGRCRCPRLLPFVAVPKFHPIPPTPEFWEGSQASRCLV